MTREEIERFLTDEGREKVRQFFAEADEESAAQGQRAEKCDDCPERAVYVIVDVRGAEVAVTCARCRRSYERFIFATGDPEAHEDHRIRRG